ncbi:MAG: helix-turn-helix transcriptional regulator, partial [Candidatus Limnocylindrales bacterium]
MVKRRASDIAVDAARRNQEQLARLGGQVSAARSRRRLTQAQLGALVGLARSTVSALERGRGGGHTLDTWQRIGVALGTSVRVDLPRDPLADTADAGHLVLQELVLRLARAAGIRGSFELPTRPADPSRSADVGLRDDLRRRLTLVECWNAIGDIGGAARSTSRKVAEAERLAPTLGHMPYSVASCWVVRATRTNRALVERYPEVFAARFPGSSLAWVRALTTGSPPPADPGLVWADISGTRLFAWRRALTGAELRAETR